MRRHDRTPIIGDDDADIHTVTSAFDDSATVGSLLPLGLWIVCDILDRIDNLIRTSLWETQSCLGCLRRGDDRRQFCFPTIYEFSCQG